MFWPKRPDKELVSENRELKKRIEKPEEGYKEALRKPARPY